MHKRMLIALLAGFHAPGMAADASGTAASSGGLFQVLLVLLVVLALMIGAAWLLKRFNVSGTSSGGVVKIVGGLAVGSRERIIVIEVADQWIVVGVTPGQINALSSMPKQDAPAAAEHAIASGSFATRLKQFIEKRNEK